MRIKTSAWLAIVLHMFDEEADGFNIADMLSSGAVRRIKIQLSIKRKPGMAVMAMVEAGERKDKGRSLSHLLRPGRSSWICGTSRIDLPGLLQKEG